MGDYEAFLFDLDGSLVGTHPVHRYMVVGNTLRELGLCANNELIDRFWFESVREVIIEKDFGIDPKVFWPTYRKYDKPELRKRYTRPYDDVDFLQKLKHRGIKLGLVTGAPQNILDIETSMLDVEFDAIVIAHDSNGIGQKPKPNGIDVCLDKLGVGKDKALYVGNGEEDILAAKNAKVLDILIDRGEYPVKVEPSMRIKSLYELEKLISS
jgi:HAD superfamily hydrolase (TIGR01549 family)